jgi:hypothetical protein
MTLTEVIIPIIFWIILFGIPLLVYLWKRKRINVSVEVINFKPIKLDKLITQIS